MKTKDPSRIRPDGACAPAQHCKMPSHSDLGRLCKVSFRFGPFGPFGVAQGSSPASPSLSAERHGRDRFPFPRTDRRASRQFHTSDAARAVLRTADRVPAQRDNPVYLLLVSGASNEVFLQRLGPNHGHESNDCADHCRKRRKSRQEENQLAIAAGNLGAHPPSQGHSASWLTPRSHEPCGWAGPPGF